MRKLLLTSAALLLAIGNIFAQLTSAISLTTSVTVATACTAPCNGTASVKASGGTPPYTYNWSTSPTQTTSTATGLCPGTYTVLVNDATPSIPNYAAATVTITCSNINPNQLALTTSVTAANACSAPCDGTGSAMVSGGTPPYTFSWSSSPMQTTATATGLCPGKYTVAVMDAAASTAMATVTVTCAGGTGTGLTLAPSATAASACTAPCDGTASAGASGGTAPYTYSWSSSPVQTTSTATGLCPGVYTVMVADASGATAAGTATVICNNINPSQMVLTTSVTPSSTCNPPCDGTAAVKVSGGTSPYLYAWSTSPVQNTAMATGLCAGIYSVTVTDASSTTAVATVTITCNTPANPLSVTTSSFKAQTCIAPCDGAAFANAAGGTPPYTYVWSSAPVQSTQAATGLCPGIYTVTVTDAAAATAVATATVMCNPGAITPLNATTTTTPATKCNAPCNGTATAYGNGGIPPYTYVWMTTPIQSTQTATGLCPGTYTVIVRDAVPAQVMVVATVVCNTPNSVSSEPDQDNILLYPNPANDMLNIDFISEFEGKIKVSIRSVLGTLVRSELFELSGPGARAVNVGSLPTGLYIIEFSTERAVVIKQFIRQ